MQIHEYVASSVLKKSFNVTLGKQEIVRASCKIQKPRFRQLKKLSRCSAVPRKTYQQCISISCWPISKLIRWNKISESYSFHRVIASIIMKLARVISFLYHFIHLIMYLFYLYSKLIVSRVTRSFWINHWIFIANKSSVFINHLCLLMQDMNVKNP